MLLALERSGAVASAALFRPGETEPFAHLALPAGGRGDAWPLVRDVLARSGAGIRDVTSFAVGTGPGSFSGIRAALALALGAALPDSLPVRGVLSAAAAVKAWRGGHPGAPRAVLLGDARRGHVWRFVEPDGDAAWAALSHTAADISLLATPEAEPGDPAPPLAPALAGAGRDFTLLASDPARLAPLLGACPFEPAAADAADVGRLAAAGLCGPALPVYLHPAVAEKNATT